MSNVIKIARPGRDVLTETDPNELIFDSSLNTFKIIAEGSLSNQLIDTDPKTITVPHGQSIIPSVYAFAKFPDGKVALPAETDFDFTVLGSRH